MNPLLRPSRTCSAEATAIQFLLMACPGKKAHAIAIKIATQRYSRNPISAQFLEAIARRAQTTDRQCQEASFVPRDRKFESISLQRRVCLSPESAFVGQEPRLSARVCAAGLASGSAETRRACRCRANRRQYLCRAIFQYRNAADGVGENATLVPTKTEPSPA